MSNSCRVILDTNVVVQAACNARGTAGRLLALARTDYEMVSSEKHLLEIRQVLGRRDFVRKGITVEGREAFLDWLREHSRMIDDPPVRIPLTIDYRDNFLVALAQRTQSLLVTQDRGILHFHPPEVPVMKPTEFGELLAGWYPDVPERLVWHNPSRDGWELTIGLLDSRQAS